MKPTVLMLAAFLFTATATIARQPQAYPPGNGVSAPKVLKQVKPQYTSAAKAAKIEGTVLLSAVIREDGTVGDLIVIRSLDTKYGLDAEAIKAAKQWVFSPGMKGGKPVPVKVTIELSFTLPS